MSTALWIGISKEIESPQHDRRSELMVRPEVLRLDHLNRVLEFLGVGFRA